MSIDDLPGVSFELTGYYCPECKRMHKKGKGKWFELHKDKMPKIPVPSKLKSRGKP